MGSAKRLFSVIVALFVIVVVARGCGLYIELSDLNDHIDRCDDDTSGRYITNDAERAALCDE